MPEEVKPEVPPKAPAREPDPAPVVPPEPAPVTAMHPMIAYQEKFNVERPVVHSPGCRCPECLEAKINALRVVDHPANCMCTTCMPHSPACACSSCGEKENKRDDTVGSLIPEIHQVFVYGSLKEGFGNHLTFLEGCKQLAKDVWLEHHGMIHIGAFPAIYSDMVWRVQGEIYEVSDLILKRLDILEGVKNGFYFRKRVEVKVKPGERIFCFTYAQYKPSMTFRRVVNGIWKGRETESVEVQNIYAPSTPAYTPPVGAFGFRPPEKPKGIDPGQLLWGIPEIDGANIKFDEKRIAPY